MESIIYDWTYSYNERRYNVIPDQFIEEPRTLYKLFSTNKNSFDSLVNQYIYATHPSQLNDIFDCNEELLDFDDIHVIRNFLNNHLISDEDFNALAINDFEKLKRIAREQFREIMYRKWGVFSMTSNPNNILMWSYYNNHEGFCIEYDFSKFDFKFCGPFPINYQPKLNSLSIKEVGVEIGVLAQCNLKDKIWEHENEWRLMILAPDGRDMMSPINNVFNEPIDHDRKFHYPISAIKSIALGNRFFDPGEIEILNNKELEINLKNKFEKKSILLDFVAENNILAHIGLRTGFTEIRFKKVKVKRMSIKKYKINAC